MTLVFRLHTFCILHFAFRIKTVGIPFLRRFMNTFKPPLS
jgi:hypothetical protein